MIRPLAFAALLVVAACVAAAPPDQRRAPAAALRAPDGATAVQVPGRHPDGITLRGLLYRPAAPGRRPAVLMMHGCAGAFSRSGRLKARPDSWARRLVGQGYVVLVLDSFNPRGVNTICQMRERPVSSDLDRPFDAFAGLAYLRGLDGVDPDRIALMGWSHGATSVLNTLRREGRAAFRPPARDFRAAVAFYPGCRRLAEEPFTPAVPLLMLLGGADDWTPAKHCVRLAKAAQGGAPVTYRVFDGAHHSFDHPDLPLRVVKAGGYRSGSGFRQVHVGSHPRAREAAVADALAFLRHGLGNGAE